jgi:hypothetical protein
MGMMIDLSRTGSFEIGFFDAIELHLGIRPANLFDMRSQGVAVSGQRMQPRHWLAVDLHK